MRKGHERGKHMDFSKFKLNDPLVELPKIENFEQLRAEGEEYEDFIVEEMGKRNWILQIRRSRRYQYRKGETLQNVEIKYNKRMSETGNLFIETTQGGIYGTCIIFVTGDYNMAFVLSTNELKRAHASGMFRTVSYPNQGMLLPVKEAKRIAIDSYYFDSQNVMENIS